MKPFVSLLAIALFTLVAGPAFAQLRSFQSSNDFTPCTGGYEHTRLPTSAVNLTIWGGSLAHFTTDPGASGEFAPAGGHGPIVVGQNSVNFPPVTPLTAIAAGQSLGDVILYCAFGGHHWFILTLWYTIP